MIAANRLRMSDLSRQKRLDTILSDDEVTPRHTVSQALEHYLDRMAIQDDGRFMAFSKGRRLDNKSRLEDLPHENAEWTVLAEVSAGSRT